MADKQLSQEPKEPAEICQITGTQQKSLQGKDTTESNITFYSPKHQKMFQQGIFR